MKQPVTLALLFVIGGGVCLSHAQDLRRDFMIARTSCQNAADSAGLGEALAKLADISRRDPNYAGLSELQASCQDAYNKQKTLEENTYRDARTAYESGRLDDARNKFQWLANRRTPYSAEAKTYVSIIARGGGATTGGSKEDYQALDRAESYIRAHDLQSAKALLEPLVGKGGDVAVKAKQKLDFIDVRRRSEADMQRAVQLQMRSPQDALRLLYGIQQQDPDYPGLAGMIKGARDRVTAAGGDVPPPPADNRAPDGHAAGPAESVNLDQGTLAMRRGDFRKALEIFQSLQISNNTADIQRLIREAREKVDEQAQRRRVDALVADAERKLKKRRYKEAAKPIGQLAALAPDDARVRNLQEQLQAKLGSGGGADAAEFEKGKREAKLASGVRKFYGGDLAAASQLLQEYVDQGGDHAAAAYFFLGAIRSTEFFLSGEKDAAKRTEAQQLFTKCRRAEARFRPPQDYVSPKIISLYQQAAGG